ncbi:hypothetical protein XYCOK13_43780 [Xylanibacillus composti]|uniref:N-acetyltransferase domain-containing protein n=2 Tax=Xylanibacillus composti TaxID=1572762 RepID=A0A8J4M452_9BACL|nr:GNAT family N-acetyltransferase [Xylanibacillus composti]GIQ71554.1 hypothetical protein XYCOK13_43780 [Xylanibacillus composti]
MKQLRPHLEEKTFVERIKYLQTKYGYKLITFVEDGEVKAASGFRICDSLAWGRYLYVDDLITDETSRSKGYASQLFDWLEEELLREKWSL